MKTSRVMLAVLVLIALQPAMVNTATLDGRVNPVYASAPQVFYNGQTITGFVRINNGFTVLAGASVLFDTFITVSGGIDLRNTGVMALNSDLMLESGVTLTTAGIISGRGHAIVLGGDLTLASTSNVNVVTIRKDTIFDGQGNSLILGDRAQLYVESNATLTLRNMTLKTGSVATTPPIKLSNVTSKLALDNVILELGSDFRFDQGQFFIHNDVIFTSTWAFVYRSGLPSYITSGAMLCFDQGTTFSMAPSTSSVTSGVRNNKFLVMQDATSVLYLNGSSLLTTNTGLSLTKGTVLLDNYVKFNSYAGQQISSSAITTTVYTRQAPSNTQAANWSPNGQYLSVVNKNTPSGSMRILTFNGTSSPTLVGSIVTTASNPIVTTWRPDGRYVAEINVAGSSMEVFLFNGYSSPTSVGGTVTVGSNPTDISFSPDGQFIVVVIQAAGGNLQVWRFNGSSAPTQLGVNVGTANGPQSADWSPDGKFIAITTSSKVLQIYSFNGVTVPATVGSAVTTGNNPVSSEWSPNGKYIAVLNQGDDTLQIYTFNGTSTPTTVGSAVAVGTSGAVGTSAGYTPVCWSPDGRYLAVINGTSNTLQIYSFNGTTSPVQIGSNVSTNAGPISVDWSADGNFIAVANTTAGTVQVFGIGYVQETEPQALSNSIVFGDPTVAGGLANVNVRFFGRAHVEVSGKVSDAST